MFHTKQCFIRKMTEEDQFDFSNKVNWKMQKELEYKWKIVIFFNFYEKWVKTLQTQLSSINLEVMRLIDSLTARLSFLNAINE